jgi:hypothetical protein
MRDPRRTLLVVSERPHAWAYLRDRLEGGRVSVAWAPADRLATALAGLSRAPWVLAGDVNSLPAEALARLQGHLFLACWVGPAPSGLPVRPRLYGAWRDVGVAVEQALVAEAAGLRLADTRGLLLPDGSCLQAGAVLEALLAAHPEGLELEGGGGRVGPVVRRARTSLRRAGLPLDVSVAGGHVGLLARSDVGAA